MLAPCVFGYNGGIHVDFDRILVKMFARAPEQHVFGFPGDIRDHGALHHDHAQQVIRATIVNSHAAYYIKGQRRAYQNWRTETDCNDGVACNGSDGGANLRQSERERR